MKGEELPLISEMIEGKPERSMREPTFALFSGIINLVYAWWQYQTILTMFSYLGSDLGFMYGLIVEVFWAMTVVGLFCGFMILLGGLIMFAFKPKVGGILTLIFSILTLMLGLGFYLGPILGIMAGVMALQEKKPPEPGDSTEVI
ncbi:MAG: hypothetical protein ACFFDP_00520 [Promethearchaeota archaeon]